jgi:uncharacterized protein (TIGR03437 family)
MRWRLQIVVLAALAAANAHGYYFWTHYRLNNAPYNPAPEKYDLNSLPNKTVTFYVTDSGPAIYGANDSFASVLSQIRQAAAAWNSVGTSDLRVAFGGVFSNGTPQSTPGGQVIFEQLPPGILGLGGVSARSDQAVTTAAGTFYPIVTSLMHLTRDLTQSPGPSYTDFFFLDVVHEMGHALGLQHTFTSSAMSQATTRATSLSRVIDTDDVAGISVLYPTPSFSSQYGSITGRVVFNTGQPVHLASVVAIRSGASPVSAFTLPDGSFRIDGVPPGSYYVYAHPLPPTADVVPPTDPGGNPIPPSGPFTTVLYPGSPTFQSAAPVQVNAGGVTPNINFSVAPRASIPIYDLQVYSFVNGNGIKPAYLNENTPVGTTTAKGVGLGVNGVATPGLTAQILGGAATIYSTLGYGDGTGATYYAMYMYFGLGGVTGPQHVVFTLPDYTFVLPNAVNLTVVNPPTINNILSNADGSISIQGTNFASDSRFFFDGSPLSLKSVDATNGVAVAVPPVGANGQRATAAVVNADGQNSFFTQPTSSAIYAYPAAPATGLLLSPSSLPAGVEAVVDITGVNTNFIQGQTTVGFGSSDVYVRRVFVLTPTHLQVNVYVASAAPLTFTEVSVITGFQSAVQAGGFQITAANPRLPVISPLVVNTVPGQNSLYPGAIVSVFGSNLSAGNSLPLVTFNGLPALVLFASPSQVNLQIPATATPGTATIQLANAVGVSYPVNVTIDAVPTTLNGILGTGSVPVDASHPAHSGDVVTILVSNFADPSASVASSRVQISVGGASAPALIVAPYSSGLFQIQTILPGLTPGVQPMSVYLDGRLVAQGSIVIQ